MMPEDLRIYGAIKWIFKDDEPAMSDQLVECCLCHRLTESYHRVSDLSVCACCYCSPKDFRQS
jgi:hypothetical protein